MKDYILGITAGLICLLFVGALVNIPNDEPIETNNIKINVKIDNIMHIDTTIPHDFDKSEFVNKTPVTHTSQGYKLRNHYGYYEIHTTQYIHNNYLFYERYVKFYDKWYKENVIVFKLQEKRKVK